MHDWNGNEALGWRSSIAWLVLDIRHGYNAGFWETLLKFPYNSFSEYNEVLQDFYNIHEGWQISVYLRQDSALIKYDMRRCCV